MCSLEHFVTYMRKTLTKIDSIPKMINIDFDKIVNNQNTKLAVLSLSLSLIKVEPHFMLLIYANARQIASI